jgi:hypothetical protein
LFLAIVLLDWGLGSFLGEFYKTRSSSCAATWLFVVISSKWFYGILSIVNELSLSEIDSSFSALFDFLSSKSSNA